MMKIIYWKLRVCSSSLRDLGKLWNGRSSVEMVDGAISSTISCVSFVMILKMRKLVYRLYFVLIVAGTEAVSECILVKWLRDSGRKAAFPKAIRAIMATAGGEMMLDIPKGIYEIAPKDFAGKEAAATNGDIWGGSILLSHRIEFLTMVRAPHCYHADVDARTVGKVPDVLERRPLSRRGSA
jgi:hypothetical protein